LETDFRQIRLPQSCEIGRNDVSPINSIAYVALVVMSVVVMLAVDYSWMKQPLDVGDFFLSAARSGRG
jgi:hypothetical protein